MKFWTRFQPGDDRSELFRSIEKIRMVVRAKMNLDQGQSIQEVLEYLKKEVLFKFLEKRKNDPKKFEFLIYGDFQSNKIRTSNFLIPSFINNEESLNYFLGVFFYIWKDAFERANLIYSRLSIQKLIEIIQELSFEEDNQPIIDYVFILLRFTIGLGVKNTDNDLKRHLTLSIFRWYFKIKFDAKFNLQYLDQFEKNLFQNFKTVIQGDENNLFQMFAQELSEGAFRFSASQNRLQSILQKGMFASVTDRHLEFRALYDVFVELRSKQRVIFSHHSLKKWENKYQELERNILKISGELARDNEEITKAIKAFQHQALYYFKRNQLRLTLVGISSYALFKKKYDWVYYLLNFNQPHDADASWTNDDISPIYFTEIIELIANQEVESYRITEFWDGHHGVESYFNEYFIILISNSIRINWRKNQEHLNEINTSLLSELCFQKKQMVVHHLNRIKGFLPYFQTNNLLKSAFNLNETWIDENLIPVIEKMVNVAEESIQNHLINSPIVPTERDLFKTDLFQSFHKNATVRNFLKLLYKKPKIALHSPTPPFCVGINEFIDKAPFIQEWNVTYFDFSSNFGKRLGIYESNFLLSSIKPHCKTITDTGLKHFLKERIESLKDYVLFGVNLDLRQDLLESYSSEDFEWSYPDDETPEEMRIAGFLGTYKKELQVFSFYNRLGYTNVYLLKKMNLGRLVQYFPVKEQEDKPFIEVDQGNIFFYRLDFFCENDDLLSKTLYSGADWLKESKDPRSDLMKQGWLRVCVKSDFEPGKGFEGYFFKIPQ